MKTMHIRSLSNFKRTIKIARILSWHCIGR